MIPIVTFALVFMGCSGAYWFFVVRPEQHAERALSRRLTPRARAAAAATGRLLKDVQALSTIAGFDEYTVGFAASIAGSALSYVVGLRLAASTPS